MNKRLTIPALGLVAVLFATVLSGPANASDSNGAMTIYFTRHAEKQTVTTETSDQGVIWTSAIVDGELEFTTTGATEMDTDASASKNKDLTTVCGISKCAEELSDKGELRADLLADYFYRRGVTQRLDAVIATHKTRTQQTVAPTAADAGLVLQTVPAGGTELAPESTSPSECATLAAIFDARADGADTILVAGHSGTLYDIMGAKDCGDGPDGLGLDITNLERFPMDEDGKVADFGDIWKVRINRKGEASFVSRVNLQPARLTVDNRTN